MTKVPSLSLDKYYRHALQDEKLPSTSQCESSVSELVHQLKTACHLYNEWTLKGSQPSNLAERFFDGSISSLDSYMQQNGRGRDANVAKQTVPRRHVNELSYEAFVMEYMLPNKPVIIQGTNKDWRAAKAWVCEDGSINMKALKKQFSRAEVCATDTRGQSQGYGSGKRRRMTFGDFATQWEQDEEEHRGLYLKDWHFVNEFPGCEAYQCPHYFTDDWLNDYYDMQQCHTPSDEQAKQDSIATSDYRFVYLGKKGTWTPIHADVLRSFSWSTNVAGRKRWRLLASEHTALLMDRFGREMAASFDCSGQSEEARKQFPNLKQAAELAIEIEQGVDEAIFVPSGWHHSVENLEDTLSINHNWLNAHNINYGWQHLQEEHASATTAIEDCRELTTAAEFEDLVQRNMAANCGLNYFSLAHFLATIALRDVARFSASEPSPNTSQQLAHAFSLHQCSLVMRALLTALQTGYHAESGKGCNEQVELNLEACSELESLRRTECALKLCVEKLRDSTDYRTVLASLRKAIALSQHVLTRRD